MMVDRSICIGGRTADAVFGDLSDARARSDVVGLRERELERVGPVPPVRSLPRYVLRLAPAAGERRAGLVCGSLALAASLSAADRPGAGGERCFAAAAVSAFGAAQACGHARAPTARKRLAGGVHHRRHPQ